MHDILILTVPGVGDAHQLNARYLNSYRPSGGRMQNHNLNALSLILTEPVELVGMLKSQLNARYLNSTVPVELVGMLKSQLKCTIS
jgi:hypothetical protein